MHFQFKAPDQHSQENERLVFAPAPEYSKCEETLRALEAAYRQSYDRTSREALEGMGEIRARHPRAAPGQIDRAVAGLSLVRALRTVARLAEERAKAILVAAGLDAEAAA